jgi:hypothetical protein
MFRQKRSTVGRMTAGTDTSERFAPRQWIYQNLTPWRIHACFTADGALLPRNSDDTSEQDGDLVVNVLSIPALGEITVHDDDARALNTLKMRRLGQLEVRPAPGELMTNLPRAISIFGCLGVVLFFGGWALFFGGGSAVPWTWFVATLVVVPVAALIIATVREIHLYHRFNDYRAASCSISSGESANRPRGSGPATRRSLEGVQRASRIRTFVDGVPRQAAEIAVLILAVLVSVIGLGVAIHLTTQLNNLLPIDYGAIFRLDNPFVNVSELARKSPAFWELLVGHFAQWVLVSVAAMVPAAMYFQFDRQRLAAVQRRWVQEVFRLDPTVRTTRDIEAKYGSQIESSFGKLTPDSGLRLRSGRRSPVIVATILLVVGWFLVISTTKVPKLVEVPVAGVSSATTGGQGTTLLWPNGGSFPVPTFFRPELSPSGYAFLGAYVFALFHVLRGYQRRDLHPKTYNTIVVRILAAYALSLVVTVVYHGPVAEVLLFFVGFMPQSALVWLRETLSRDKGVWKHLPLDEPAPLTDLEGIDLYDRTRLAEEGINNVEALAHGDIVNLMSSTRIAAAELVDWTDQAIMYLHVGGNARSLGESSDHAPRTKAPAPPDVHANLCYLRSFGIRTATDLMQAYEQALRRGGKDPVRRAAEVELLRNALELPGSPRRSVWTIQSIIDTLHDEEWFMQVRNWRNSEFGAFDAWYWYLDGNDWMLTHTKELPRRVKQAMCQFESVPMIDHAPPAEWESGNAEVSAN